MDVEPLLTNLRLDHRALEQELTAELTRPAADPAKISELKRRKLKIKDQIAKLSDHSVH